MVVKNTVSQLYNHSAFDLNKTEQPVIAADLHQKQSESVKQQSQQFQQVRSHDSLSLSLVSPIRIIALIAAIAVTPSLLFSRKIFLKNVS